MNNLEWEVINLNDEKKMAEVKSFLLQSDLVLDFVDYCLVVRHDNKIIGTCSKQYNLIKCIALCKKFTGFNLSTQLMLKVLAQINAEGYDESFVHYY